MKMSQAFVAVAATALGVGQAAADPGYYASVEALFLAPKINSQGFETVFYDGVDHLAVDTDGSFSDDLEAGYRVVIGKESCDGFGVRFRYFNFDPDVHYDGLWDAGSGTVSVVGDVGVEVEAIDFDVTQRAEFRAWDLIVSGGLRYGNVEINQPAGFFGGIGAVVFAGATGVEFEGVGPTFSIEAQRPIRCSNFSIIGRARVSLLYGDIDYTPAFRAGGTFTIEDEFVQAWEFQFGLGYNRCIGSGRDLNLGIFWEAQRWDSDSNFLGDLALHGLALQAGLGF